VVEFHLSGYATTQASGLRQSRFRTMGLLTLIASGLPVIRPEPNPTTPGGERYRLWVLKKSLTRKWPKKLCVKKPYTRLP
jgi:hypothetical protein